MRGRARAGLRQARRLYAHAPAPARAVLRLAVAATALGAVSTAAWAVVSVRRPRGHDVVTSMSSREAAPDGARARTPVVLVHGLGMSSRSMADLVRALGRTTWTLAPDLPGYGRSPQPRAGTLGVQDLGRALLGWMDEHEVGDAVLVGHSLGAQVAGEVARAAPHRVRRLVVVGPTGDPRRPSVLHQALRLLRGAVREPPMLVLVAAGDYLRAGPGQMVVLMRRAVQRARHELDVTVRVPLLVVRGSDDLVCTQAWCEQIVRTTQDSRLVVVPRSAHGLTFRPPQALVDLLLEEVAAADAAYAQEPQRPSP